MNKFPESGGIKVLQDQILPFVDTIINNMQSKTSLSQFEFAEFLQQLFSCFYVTACNGREQAIIALTREEKTELMYSNFIESSIFKTANNYSMQTIILSKATHKMLNCLFDFVYR